MAKQLLLARLQVGKGPVNKFSCRRAGTNSPNVHVAAVSSLFGTGSRVTLAI